MDPGTGYRLLDEEETIQEGDEFYYTSTSEWRAAIASIGDTSQNRPSLQYRRKKNWNGSSIQVILEPMNKVTVEKPQRLVGVQFNALKSGSFVYRRGVPHIKSGFRLTNIMDGTVCAPGLSDTYTPVESGSTITIEVP